MFKILTVYIMVFEEEKNLLKYCFVLFCFKVKVIGFFYPFIILTYHLLHRNKPGINHVKIHYFTVDNRELLCSSRAYSSKALFPCTTPELFSSYA